MKKGMIFRLLFFSLIIAPIVPILAEKPDGIKLPKPFPSQTYDSLAYDIVGGLMQNNGMVYAKAENYKSTGFIDVEGYAMVNCHLPSSTGYGAVFYDSSKKYLAGYKDSKGNPAQIAVPDGAKYLRTCYRLDEKKTPFIHLYECAAETDVESLLLKLYDEQRKTRSLLGRMLVPDYKVAIGDGCFTYNSVKNGIGYLDASLPETYQPVFRIPSHVVFNNGDILVVSEVQRKETKLKGVSVGLALSRDGGESWEHMDFNLKCSGNPNLVYDKINDRIFLFLGLSCYSSKDHGVTWSFVADLSSLKPDGWEKMYASPTVGIQLENGILATPFILMNGSGKEISRNSNAVVFSRDYGKTWEVTAVTSKDIIANEVTIAEYESNQIMINARGGTEITWAALNPGRRVFIPSVKSPDNISAWKIDGWQTDLSDRHLSEPVCNASFISVQFGKHRFGLFCNPNTQGFPRKNLVLRVSSDFRNWTEVGLLTEVGKEIYGYCSLNYNGEKLTFVYEDPTSGILFCDLTPYMDEILTKMAMNRLLYKDYQ